MENQKEKQSEKQSVENTLLNARNESLQNMQKTSIRPHGKLWGMDVFSWYLPRPELLANTIHTFPFPIVWVGNVNDILATFELDPQVASQLNTLLFHDSSRLRLPVDSWLTVKNIASVSNLEDALRLLSSFKQRNAVLLFTASGEDWELSKETFEKYLSIHQAI